MLSHVKLPSAIAILLFLLVGCNVKDFDSKTKSQVSEIKWLGEKGNSFGIYASSITTTNQNNKQAWVHFPKSNDNSTVPVERVSDFLFEINCQARSYRIVKATDSKGRDLELGKSDWDIPAPTGSFYPVIIAICTPN